MPLLANSSLHRSTTDATGIAIGIRYILFKKLPNRFCRLSITAAASEISSRSGMHTTVKRMVFPAACKKALLEKIVR